MRLVHEIDGPMQVALVGHGATTAVTMVGELDGEVIHIEGDPERPIPPALVTQGKP